MLRQQLAGPLASKAPPHLMTDPTRLVPSQRPPAEATQAIPSSPAPSGQIGGRAMLAPGDSLSGHLAKLQQEPPSRPGRRRAKEDDDPLTATMAGNGPGDHLADHRGRRPGRGQ